MGNLVTVYLAAQRDASWTYWTRLDCLYASLVLLKKYTSGMPVVIYHEDYKEEDKQRMLSTGLDIKFKQIDFSTHQQYHVNLRPDNRVGSYGYCMMCRFFSGVMQQDPIFADYSHYMRLDDDSYIVRPVNNFQEMMQHDYVYNSFFSDPHETLWDFTTKFMRQNSIPLTETLKDGVPYTNFHISSFSLWKDPIIKKYTDAIEAENGCLKYRWDDAQIGRMIMMIASQIGKKVAKVDFPYRHNQHCCHTGDHNENCYDGKNEHFQWGPPSYLLKR